MEYSWEKRDKWEALKGGEAALNDIDSNMALALFFQLDGKCYEVKDRWGNS